MDAGRRSCIARQYPDGGAPGGRRPRGRGVHNASESSADDHRPGLGQAAAHLLGEPALLLARLARSAHRDVGGHPRIASSRLAAFALSSGSFPLPHFGDCTQLGQPSRHGQRLIASSVAPSRRPPFANPRSEMPAPPG